MIYADRINLVMSSGQTYIENLINEAYYDLEYDDVVLEAEGSGGILSRIREIIAKISNSIKNFFTNIKSKMLKTKIKVNGKALKEMDKRKRKAKKIIDDTRKTRDPNKLKMLENAAKALAVATVATLAIGRHQYKKTIKRANEGDKTFEKTSGVYCDAANKLDEIQGGIDSINHCVGLLNRQINDNYDKGRSKAGKELNRKLEKSKAKKEEVLSDLYTQYDTVRTNNKYKVSKGICKLEKKGDTSRISQTPLRIYLSLLKVFNRDRQEYENAVMSYNASVASLKQSAQNKGLTTD